MVASAGGRLPGSILPSTCLILLAHFFLPSPVTLEPRRDTIYGAVLLSFHSLRPPAGESSNSRRPRRENLSLAHDREEKRNESSWLPSKGGSLSTIVSIFESIFLLKLRKSRVSPRSDGATASVRAFSDGDAGYVRIADAFQS